MENDFYRGSCCGHAIFCSVYLNVIESLIWIELFGHNKPFHLLRLARRSFQNLFLPVGILSEWQEPQIHASFWYQHP